MVRTLPSAAMASSSGCSSSGMSTSSDSPAATSRTMYALLFDGPMGPILTMRTSPSSMTVSSAAGTLCRRLGSAGDSQRRFERALLRLVLLTLDHGVHIGQRRPARRDLLPACRFDPQLLGHHPDHHARLGGAEPG